MSKKVKIDAELNPLGQLDPFSAELLTEQLENCLNNGAHNIVVNSKKIFPFLPTAMKYIQNFILHDLYNYSPFSIAFVNINKRCLETFPLKEYPLVGDKLIFQMPQYAQAYFKGGAIINCKNCGMTLHIQRLEEQSCPNCGVPFKIKR